MVLWYSTFSEQYRRVHSDTFLQRYWQHGSTGNHGQPLMKIVKALIGPCLHKVFKALQNQTSGAVTIYMDDLMATENFNAPQLSPSQDLDPEVL